MYGLTSFGITTNLWFAAYDGEVTDHGDHLVARSPTNPTYHWGNFLVLRAPPETESAAHWIETFRRAIADHQPTSHVAMTWDAVGGERGAAAEFEALGFESLPSSYLATEALAPLPRPLGVDATMRALASDEDWTRAEALQVLCREPVYDEAEYVTFKREQFARYRAMSRDGLGAWFGAFVGDELVGDLGVFGRDGAARYQSVETHPAWRRRGVCGALVRYAGAWAKRELGARTLVMEANPDDIAIEIYRAAGFEDRESVSQIKVHGARAKALLGASTR